MAKYLWEFRARESIRIKTRKAISRSENILAREIKYSRDRTENGKRAEIAEGSPELTFDYKNEHNLKIYSREMSRLTLRELSRAFESFCMK